MCQNQRAKIAKISLLQPELPEEQGALMPSHVQSSSPLERLWRSFGCTCRPQSCDSCDWSCNVRVHGTVIPFRVFVCLWSSPAWAFPTRTGYVAMSSSGLVHSTIACFGQLLPTALCPLMVAHAGVYCNKDKDNLITRAAPYAAVLGYMSNCNMSHPVVW